MDPIEILMNEHRLIERVLDAIEIAADELERGRRVRPGLFLEAADFLAGFADGCHHHKEEDVLFPAMVEGGMPPGGGPIAVMLDEHEQGRACIRVIRDRAGRLEAGDATSVRQLVAGVRAYVALLRDHIAKEDEVLFPMAGQVLAADRLARLGEEFNRIVRAEADGGAHQRFVELADRLIDEVAAATT